MAQANRIRIRRSNAPVIELIDGVEMVVYPAGYNGGARVFGSHRDQDGGHPHPQRVEAVLPIRPAEGPVINAVA